MGFGEGDFGDFSSALFGGDGGTSVLDPGDFTLSQPGGSTLMEGFNPSGGSVGGLSDVLRGLGGPAQYGRDLYAGSDVQLPDGGGSGGGGGFMSGLRSIGSGFGDVAKAALPAAQIGAAGLGAYSNYQASQQRAAQSKLAQQGAQRQNEIGAAAQAQAAPISNFATQQLQRASAGEVQPAIQTQIDEWVRGAEAKARAYAAGSGQSNSTQLTQWLSWIQRQGQAMRAAAIDAQQKTALQAASTAGNLLAVGGNVAGQQAATATATGSGIDNLLALANQQLNRLSAAAG